jgi:23S rRNA (guanosine2251-2'-O)-methyltransferase
MKHTMRAYAILHNIRSLHNVGSLFRTADAAGVTKIFLTGYTPSPVDVFGRVRMEIAKTALGAEKTVVWKKYSRIDAALKELKKERAVIIALEQNNRAVAYTRMRPRQNFALVVGNEITGLSKTALARCDTVVEIPMRGKKESLNVAVAFGIALFTLIHNAGI